MGELLLVRHAPTSWSGHRFCGRADQPLGREGRQVARRLAEVLASGVLAGVPRDIRIVSSPADRARHTAEAIAAAVADARVDLDDRWSEADVGRAEGLTFDELARLEPELAERLARGEADIDWPGGESAASLADRVRSALRDLEVAASPTVVVVSHAGPLRIAAAIALGVPIDAVPFLEPGGYRSVASRPSG